MGTDLRLKAACRRNPLPRLPGSADPMADGMLGRPDDHLEAGVAPQ